MGRSVLFDVIAPALRHRLACRRTLHRNPCGFLATLGVSWSLPGGWLALPLSLLSVPFSGG